MKNNIFNNSSNTKKSILIVDDEKANLDLLNKILSEKEYEIRLAINPAFALHSAFYKPPDLVLLDIKMPEFDGFTFCEKLKEHPLTASIPIIIISAINDTRSKIKAFEAGGVDYITKPFNESEVLARVQTQLELYLMRTQLERLVQDRTEALQISKERFDEMANNIQDVFWLYDLETQSVIYANSAYEKIWGRSVKALIERYDEWRDSIHPDDREYAEISFQRLIETGGGNSREYRIIRPDGEVRWIADNGFLVKNENGEIVRITGVAKDITDKKKLEAQLLQVQKMESIGTLAGGIAHDFNNMLGIIMGNISLALSMLNENETLYEILSNVLKGANKAKNLTHQLLTFARGGAPIKKVMDINKVIKDSATFSTRGTAATCCFEFASDLWLVEIDEGQINQVIGNLIINAYQAMPNGGTIKLQTENIFIESNTALPLPPGQYIKFTVEDEGCGISQKYIQKIFDPYFTTKQKGSGLGLATTYSIIKKHGGDITVDSKIEKGTVFHIFLPAASPESTVEIIDAEGHVYVGKGKVLIMDDQVQILEILKKMLNRMGYEVASAADGIQTIEMYRNALEANHPFDLVILDLTVPGGMGGAKTVIELLKMDPKVKAVVSSGYSGDPIMGNYKDYGFCGVIPKPYTTSQLSVVLKKIFSEKC